MHIKLKIVIFMTLLQGTNSIVLKAGRGAISYEQAIRELVEKTEEELLIISPYLSKDILEDFERLDKPDAPAVRIGVCPGDHHGEKETARYVFTGQLNPHILLTYHERGFEVKRNCNVHCKIILSDKKVGIVGSANLSFAAFKPERWEIGILLYRDDSEKWPLYEYASRLVKESKIIRRVEMLRWIKMLKEHKSKIASIEEIQNELDQQLQEKIMQERKRATGKGEALVLFADVDQIENALKRRKDGFVGLIKRGSSYYRFPDCDYHLAVLLEEMRFVPVLLYDREDEIRAYGKIIEADYGSIDTLIRSFAHKGYPGIRDGIVPIDRGYSDLSVLDNRKTHILVLIKDLKRFRRPIRKDKIQNSLKKKGLPDSFHGPGGRYIPNSIYQEAVS